MGHAKANRPVASIIAAVFGAALISAALLSPAGTGVAEAQSEPATAANGVLLPPPDFDPAAARNPDLTGSTTVPPTSTPEVSTTEGSTAAEAPDATTDAPEAATEAPPDGSAVTTSLGGSDVAVSSVVVSNEVDRPGKRSRKK